MDTVNVDAVQWPAVIGLLPERRHKVLLSVRIDHDVLEWFRAQGPGYQTRINAVLRVWMEAARDGERR